MVNVPFFNKFQKSRTCNHYIDGLVKSMTGLSMSPALVTPKTKHQLIDIEDSDQNKEEIETPKKKKKTKKNQNQSCKAGKTF